MTDVDVDDRCDSDDVDDRRRRDDVGDSAGNGMDSDDGDDDRYEGSVCRPRWS